MKLLRMLGLALAALLAVPLAACNLDAQGGVNSASAGHACAIAGTVARTAEEIAAVLSAEGLAQGKIAVLVPLIQEGQLILTATCQIVAPPGASPAAVAAAASVHGPAIALEDPGDVPVQPVT